MCGALRYRGDMDRAATEIATRVCLREIRKRLDGAASISRAAEVCAESGQIAKAIEVALDIEQLAYEASRLLDAAIHALKCNLLMCRLVHISLL